MCFLSASVTRKDLQFGTRTDPSFQRHYRFRPTTSEVGRAKDLSAPPSIYKGILPEIRSLLPVPNCPNMLCATACEGKLSRIAFQAHYPEYPLKSVHNRAIVLR